ncbi:hypothetical protein AGMMS49587_07370 [Spirochaetia bacterium]|nr:hypothetical protein AGMMS49587_07370 [Spirochaetia bacterium]
MKLLLVLGSDDTSDLISLHLKPLGFEMVRYHHVLKAMDNVDEADPAAIIISAGDFPRHWKTLVQFVRSERSRESCPIVVLHNGNIPLESCTQAFYIGVSGIVNESLDAKEMDRLQHILTRYIPTEEKRRARRFFNLNGDHIGFLVSSPLDNVIIPGEVKSISSSGLSFLPVYASMTKDITESMVLSGCSLRAGENILSPVCRIVRGGRIVSLEFISFPPEEYKILQNYLKALPMQELKDRQEKLREAAL